MIRWMSGSWWAAVLVLMVAGCANIGSGETGGGGTAVAQQTHSRGTTLASQPGTSRLSRSMWFQSVQMTSAASGWALDYSANPADSGVAPRILLARTVNDGRTWVDVTPAAARPMLATTFASEVLDPVDDQHVYLAVTASTHDMSNRVLNTTAIFATADGGSTWTESVPVKAAGTVTGVTFANATDGWLLLDAANGTTRRPRPWLFRTTDGGRHWSPAATAPPPGSGGLNDFCQKLGITFPTATIGWLTISCRSGAYVEVSHDGGSTWAEQSLPLAANPCRSSSGPCTISGPRFTGGSAFLTVAQASGGSVPALLASPDLGQTWHLLALPTTASQYPQIRFFSPADGVLVTAGPQGALGDVFYTTADGGQTWTPVPQGKHFTQPGDTVDFVTPQVGVVWSQGGGTQSSTSPPLYMTTDSGHTWHPFTPQFVG
jgi:photosystem II stability/assembly factor-like uncharacterized protein